MHGNKQPTKTGSRFGPPQKYQPTHALLAHFNLIKNYFTDAKYF